MRSGSTLQAMPAKKGKAMPMDREALKKWILDSRAEMTAAVKGLLDTPGISIADRKWLALELKAVERAKENDDRLLGQNTRDGPAFP
jgi:hypothetical protein